MAGTRTGAYVVALWAVLVATVSPLQASVRTLSEAALARSSAAAVRGVVLATSAQWDPAADAIYTFVAIAVERSWGLDGQPAAVVLKQLGGVVGTTALVVGGQARFETGEVVFVLLDVRPRDLTLSVAGLEQGKWTLSGPSGRQGAVPRWQRSFRDTGSALEERSTLDLEALAGLAGTRAHAAGARLAPPTLPRSWPASGVSTPVNVSAPIAARWHEADSGEPVYVDTQAGGHPQFLGGGLAQLSNAAAMWNAAGSLNLVDGVPRGPRCFNNDEPFDGRISVTYGDPCDEIADDGSTLAIGGAYFSATDIRTVGGIGYWKMTKGVVIADGAPAKYAAMSSGCYEELLAHELGHAIGLAHIVTGPAVMSPSLSAGCTGRQVSVPLSATDFLAMAAAYPSATVLPPGTPTGLWSSAVGATVALQWHMPATGGVPSVYELQVGSRLGQSDLAVLALSAPSIVVPGVASGTYFVRLVAHNAAGSSRPTADLEVRVAPTSRDDRASETGAAVTLSWLPVEPHGMPVSYLVLAGHVPGAMTYQIPSVGTSITVPGVGAGTYFVRVVAASQAGLTPVTAETALVVHPQ